MNINNLEKYGFNDWFLKNFNQDMYKGEDFSLARIISLSKNYYKVINNDFEGLAELTGKLLYMSDNAQDLPVVGDFVVIQAYDTSNAFIHEILPRKSVIKRKTAGNKIDFQIISSNIDTALLFQSVETKISLNLVERYLSSVNEDNINPVLLLSKVDLISEEELKEIVSQIKTNLFGDLQIIPYSIQDENSLEQIKSLFKSGKTYCLIGKSGVGKSSLINAISKSSQLETSSVREGDSKGKHTTTMRQMLFLDNGAMIIDTPGMREFASIGVEKGISDTFFDITEKSTTCKYKNCTHTNEDGCAVIEAVENNEIPMERYNNYMKLMKENKYYEMSYQEKRKRGKDIAKMVKEVKQHKDKYKR